MHVIDIKFFWSSLLHCKFFFSQELHVTMQNCRCYSKPLQISKQQRGITAESVALIKSIEITLNVIHFFPKLSYGGYFYLWIPYELIGSLKIACHFNWNQNHRISLLHLQLFSMKVIQFLCHSLWLPVYICSVVGLCVEEFPCRAMIHELNWKKLQEKGRNHFWKEIVVGGTTERPQFQQQGQ